MGNLPSVRARMSLAIHRHPRGSETRMLFQVGIADPSGLLSHGLIDSIARDTVDRTINRIKQQLEDAPAHPDPAA
jgi:hypothetical protein